MEVVPLRFPWRSGSRPTASPAGPGPRGLLVTGLHGSYVSDNTSHMAPSKWPQHHLLQAPGLQLRWGGTVSLPAFPSPSAPGTTFHTQLSHQQESWVTVIWATVSKSNGARLYADQRVSRTPQATLAHDLEGFGDMGYPSWLPDGSLPALSGVRSDPPWAYTAQGDSLESAQTRVFLVLSIPSPALAWVCLGLSCMFPRPLHECRVPWRLAWGQSSA